MNPATIAFVIWYYFRLHAASTLPFLTSVIVGQNDISWERCFEEEEDKVSHLVARIDLYSRVCELWCVDYPESWLLFLSDSICESIVLFIGLFGRAGCWWGPSRRKRAVLAYRGESSQKRSDDIRREECIHQTRNMKAVSNVTLLLTLIGKLFRPQRPSDSYIGLDATENWKR